MDFPDKPRVIYGKNPLIEVSCQLRFPPILKIDVDVPANFQEAIRSDFPLYELKSQVKLPPNIPKEIAAAMARDMPIALAGNKQHNFSSSDRNWNLKLSRDGLTLVCRKYERWEAFKNHLEGPFKALIDNYQPAYFSHICLKYRDVIRRKSIGLGNSPWVELLAPWICGALSISTDETDVESTQTATVFSIQSNKAKVQATYGLATEEPSKDRVFMIDAHLFTEPRTESSNAFNQLTTLNRQAGLFFRWCITDKLHAALQPQSATNA